ncbi:MAG: hypothetical protein U0Q15_09250 [Kineosporiaceae bacterium]
MRRTKLAALGTAGVLALGGAALFVPAGADAATGTTSPTDRAQARLTSLKDALKGLVSDGTLTQAQADKVASTLADKGYGGPGMGGMGPGGMGMGRGMRGAFGGPEELAKILGITTEELRTKLESGKTLTQIAAEKKISKADLVAKLVAAAKTSLATAVKDGRLTQAQADTISKDLATRIGEMVDRTGPGRGMGGGFGHRGHGPGEDGDGPGSGGGPGDGDGPGSGTSTPAPSSTTNNSSSTADAVVADV